MRLRLAVPGVIWAAALALIVGYGCSPKTPACAPVNDYLVRLGDYTLRLPGELSPDVRPFQGEKLRAVQREAREHPCEPEVVEAVTFRSRSIDHEGLPPGLNRITQITLKAESSTFNPVRGPLSSVRGYEPRQIRGSDGKLTVDPIRRQQALCSPDHKKPTGFCYVSLELGGGLYAELALSTDDYEFSQWPDLFSRVDVFSQSLIYVSSGEK